MIQRKQASSKLSTFTSIMIPASYNNYIKLGRTQRGMLNCKLCSCHVRRIHLTFVVDEEVNLIFYCVSGACGGALVILALLIGIYIGKAKKSFD